MRRTMAIGALLACASFVQQAPGATRVTGAAQLPDGRWLVSGSFDEWVHVWDVATGRVIRTLSEHPGHVKSLAFSSDGELLPATGADGVHVWDLPAAGRHLFNLGRDGGERSATELVVLAGVGDHPILASSNHAKRAKYWSAPGGGCVAVPCPRASGARTVAARMMAPSDQRCRSLHCITTALAMAAGQYVTYGGA